MIAAALICLFALATTATLLSLADSWLRAQGAYRSLMRERVLLEAGFVPQVDACALALRQPRRAVGFTAQGRMHRAAPVNSPIVPPLVGDAA